MKAYLVLLLALTCCLMFAAQAAALEVTALAPDTYEAVALETIFDEPNPYYVDRDYTISLVPDELLAEIEDKEAIWIKTGNGNKHNADENHLTFEVDASVRVYIAYDRRAAEPPEWILNGFDDMEVDLATTDVALGLWRSKEEYPPGLVQLHGNDFGGAKGASSNYAAFVVIGTPLPVDAAGKLAATWGNLKSAEF